MEWSLPASLVVSEGNSDEIVFASQSGRLSEGHSDGLCQPVWPSV